MLFLQIQFLALFQTPVFWATAVFLLADLLTGVPRAIVEKKFNWNRFPIAFYKAYFYFITFFVLRCFFQGTDLPIPLWTSGDVCCMWIIVLKEVISVLQNAKGFLTAQNQTNPMLDLIIDFLRLDVFHTVLSKIPGMTPELQAAEDKDLNDLKQDTDVVKP